MSIVRDNLNIVNPAGNTVAGGRETQVNFFGYRTLDVDMDEAFSGIDNTVYTAASGSTWDNTQNTPLYVGQYTGANQTVYKVEIEDVATNLGFPYDTFRWYKNGSSTPEQTGIAITGGTAQDLDQGVQIKFILSQFSFYKTLILT